MGQQALYIPTKVAAGQDNTDITIAFRAIERWASGLSGVMSIPYVFTGSLTASTSPPVTPYQNLVISGLSATLGTAGSSSTTVQLLIDGSVVASVTVPAGVTYNYTSGLVIPVRSRTDNYAISISSAGSGAANLGGEIELSSVI